MSTELTRHQEARPESVDQERWLKPAVDVYENESEWLITADVPGVKQDLLKLHLDGDELLIEARRSAIEGVELGFVGYRRTFSLPTGVSGDKVVAKLNQGVVSIHLPKSEAIKPRRIAVSAG